jgi:hypothetical protein
LGIADVEWRADFPLANWHHSPNPASVNAKPNRAKEMCPLLFSNVLASLLNMTEETDSQKHSLLSDYSKALLDQLTGEYRIIQDKIDKIAGFRFTIRGWSVTLVVTFAFGANTLKLPPYWILSALLPLAAFLLMERSQQRNHDTLCIRAVRIERRIWRILRLSAPGGAEIMIGGMVPRLAHELVEEHRSSNPAIRWLGQIEGRPAKALALSAMNSCRFSMPSIQTTRKMRSFAQMHSSHL